MSVEENKAQKAYSARIQSFVKGIAEILDVDPKTILYGLSGGVPVPQLRSRDLSNCMQDKVNGILVQPSIINGNALTPWDRENLYKNPPPPNMALFRVDIVDVTSGRNTGSCYEFTFEIITDPSTSQEYLHRMTEWGVTRQRPLPSRI